MNIIQNQKYLLSFNADIQKENTLTAVLETTILIATRSDILSMVCIFSDHPDGRAVTQNNLG